MGAGKTVLSAQNQGCRQAVFGSLDGREGIIIFRFSFSKAGPYIGGEIKIGNCPIGIIALACDNFDQFERSGLCR